MDDASAVLALRSGDLTAFGRIYDAYSGRLLAYATALLGDPDAASDAVHDAFLLAHDRIDQLRDPTLLRPWLYAITRRQAQRTLRTRGRTAPVEAAAEVSADEIRWDQGLDADDARLLVLAALAGLSEGDREVIELALRHELDNAAVARALGRSSSHASALVSRAKQQFDVALSAVLLMRTRGRDCADLQQLVGEATTITPLLRKRIARHAKSCDSCAGNRRAAIAVLPGVALALPFQAAPDWLRSGLVAESGALRTGATDRLADNAGLTFDADGFPTTQAPHHRRWVVAAAVTAVLVLVVAGATATTAGRFAEGSSTARLKPVAADTTLAEPTPAAAPSPSTAAPTKPPASAPPSAAATAVAPNSRNSSAPRVAPSAEPTQATGVSEAASNAVAPAPPPAQAPVPAPKQAPAPLPKVVADWTLLESSECDRTLDVGVIASVSGATVTRVSARWSTSSASGSVDLTRASGSDWQGALLNVPGGGEARLSVRITTAQGVTVTSDVQSISLPCGN